MMLKIEKNIPVPENNRKGPLRLLAERMEIGDSVACDTAAQANAIRTILNELHRGGDPHSDDMDERYPPPAAITRTVDGVPRVWRVR